MVKKIDVPRELWCDFVNILYAATQHVKQTEENSDCLNFIRNEIQRSIENGDVLVIEGKIVDKESFLKESKDVN